MKSALHIKRIIIIIIMALIKPTHLVLCSVVNLFLILINALINTSLIFYDAALEAALLCLDLFSLIH